LGPQFRSIPHFAGALLWSGARYHQSKNGLLNYRHSPTRQWRMVYFSPLRNTWLRLIRTHPVGGGILTRRSSIELIF